MSMIFLQDSVKYPLSKYTTTLQGHNYLAFHNSRYTPSNIPCSKRNTYSNGRLKMIKQHGTIDSQGLQKVNTNSRLTCMFANFHWSAEWSAQKQPHLRYKEEQLLMYHSLEMWSIGGLITRYQRFQFLIHIRRHQLGNVSRFHVAQFCPESACPWFFFKTQSNILWASMLQPYRHKTIWDSTIAGTHHQTSM
jgi:hypothetical protein